jgi:hypothetical protein
MNMRPFFAALCAILACCTLMCTQKKQDVQKKTACVVGADTLTLSAVADLVPGPLPEQQKVSRAALQCLLSRQACTGSYAEKDKTFFSDLSSQLSSQTGQAWTPQASASLYWAAKAVRAKLRELPSVMAVAAYVDSLFATTVKQQDGGVRQLLLANDSLLKTMERAATRTELEQVLASVFRIPLATAGVLADFLASEDLESKGMADASSYVKGLVASDAAPARHAAAGPTAEELLKKTQENLKLALRHRNQQSICDSIKKHLPNLEALYKKQLKVHQNVEGTVWVTFVINPDGSVSTARARSSEISEKDFLNPLSQYVQKIHFLRIPEELGPMTFEFPFEFTPEQ